LPNKDYTRIRRFMDVDDPFVSGGHQIIKTAGATRHQERVDSTPEWTQSNDEVRKLLLVAFPRLNEESAVGRRQRIRATKWLRVIHLYFRMGWTASKVEEEMGLKCYEGQSAGHSVIVVCQYIFRVRNGLTAIGRVRGARPRGRPKNSNTI
jgi:hypothetical protein